MDLQDAPGGGNAAAVEAMQQGALDPEIAKLIEAGDEGRLEVIADREPGRFSGASWQQRWAVLDMLQCGTTDAIEERGIRNLLRDASVTDRGAILRRVDQNGDHHDLDELVFHDIDDEAIRAEVLELVQQTGSLKKERGVISDFDDTVSPHRDKRSGSEFAGAAELYAELEGEEPGDVHYVTARPGMFAGGVKGKLAKLGMPKGTVEPGSLSRILGEGEAGMEAEKIEDIERILLLHPGQRFVLIGDDSQRDPAAYEAIMKKFPDRVERVVIRRTGHAHEPERKGLDYVDDFVEAKALFD